MTLVEDIIKVVMAHNGIVLPDVTLRDVPTQGRLDATASHMLAAALSGVPVAEGLFNATRPIIDGLLTQAVGPNRMRTELKLVVGAENAEAIVARVQGDQCS